MDGEEDRAKWRACTERVARADADDICKRRVAGRLPAKGKQEISDGYFAVLGDTQRNTFGLW